MGESPLTPRQVSRITCHVNHRLSNAVTERLARLGIATALVESGRSVRLHRRPRRFGIPGTWDKPEDAPVDIFRFTVDRSGSQTAVQSLIDAGGLYAPGRGTIFAQDITEYSFEAAPSIQEIPLVEEPAADSDQSKSSRKRRPPRQPINDLAVLTCILSMPGSGETLAREALELGTCVPVVTLGIGTGLRDRLGLLRITIPPEKDVVHLVVPVHDTKSIIRMLIEHMNLNRPGRGIVFQTPARCGMIDTRLRIGRQEHAASIEQIITAIDELKNDTTWRARFPALEQERIGVSPPLLRNNYEFTIVSEEGVTGELVSSALEAGAGGATTARIRRITPADTATGIAAREYTTIVVSDTAREQVIDSLLATGFIGEDRTNRLQIQPVPAAFTHT